MMWPCTLAIKPETIWVYASTLSKSFKLLPSVLETCLQHKITQNICRLNRRQTVRLKFISLH